MEIVLSLICVILGWMGNHVYSRRGSKELSRLKDDFRLVVQKLPAELVAALRADQRRDLTVGELNKLLKDLTVDPESDELTACQMCGSRNLDRDSGAEVDWDRGGPSLSHFVEITTCKDCGWSNEVGTSQSGEQLYTEAHRPL